MGDPGFEPGTRTRDLFLIRSERGRVCVGRVRVSPVPIGLCVPDADRCGRDPGGYRQFMEYVSEHADTAHAREVARAHAESIAERLSLIAAFQRENPDRTGLGCHTCPPGVGPHSIAEHLPEGCQPIDEARVATNSEAA